ncbi:putative DNA (cytosine-5)-methyltransferase 1 [Nannochloris sp. 'desiccata']|nr:putative DNA (cytosine-5)-methyltransferase 1 [Chlorella desiccata (nom. nud.)]
MLGFVQRRLDASSHFGTPSHATSSFTVVPFSPSPAKPRTVCAIRDVRKLNEELNGSWWLGSPLPSSTIVAEHYPYRPLLSNFVAMTDTARHQAATEATRDIEERCPHEPSFFLPATAHFNGVRLEAIEDGDPNFDVHVGDFILISTGDHDSKAQVTEFYTAANDTRRMRIHWFYDVMETELVVHKADGSVTLGGLSIDQRQLWRAKDRDNAVYITDYDIGAIIKKINVVKVEPEGSPPTDPEAFWYSEEVDRRFFTFESPQAEEPRSKALWAGKVREIRKMDVFCGAGGLAYMGQQQELAGGRCRIKNQWAIDYEEDMTATFKGNFRDAHVVTSGTDEWLALCQEVFDLYQSLPRKLQSIVDSEKIAGGSAGGGASGCRQQQQNQRDDALIYPSRSLVMEQRAKKGGRASIKNEEDSATGAAAADTEGVEPTVDMETDNEEEEEEEELNFPAAKRTKTSQGKKAAATATTTKSAKVTKTAPKKKASKSADKTDSKAHPTITTDNTSSTDNEEDFEVDFIMGVRLAEKAPRATRGVCTDQLIDFIAKEDRWLEFYVRWEGFGPDFDTWEPADNLEGCVEKVALFLQRLRCNKLIPFPGDVDLFVGGPPCQGVSGNNRHALTKNILLDPRNRQLLVFLAMVAWWRPSFVLMENVQDILKKEDGAYVKYAMGQMINERYQTRLSMLAAGNYGVAQGRWRVFMWAAKVGEQLPAFPEPTHLCRDFQCPVFSKGKQLVAGFLTEESALAAHPPVLLGDVLGDFPEVDNFEVGDRHNWKSAPQTIPQAWLRRNPLPFATSLKERLKFHSEYNGGGHVLNSALRDLLKEEGFEALGNLWMNARSCLIPGQTTKRQRTDGISAGSFAYESIQAGLQTLLPSSDSVREVAALQLEASRKGYAHSIGQRVAQVLECYFEQYKSGTLGNLPDHRPLCCNTDDYLRLAGVPPREHVTDESSFRSLEGVVVHGSSRTACSGHTHHPRIDGKTDCPGGGTHDRADKADRGKKQGRVDWAQSDGWRGVSIDGCDSFTVLMATGDLLCPRWCITFKDGKCHGRTACFGRVHTTEVLPTVVGRAEPHNLRIAHPVQDRVLTIREMARCQGFPDYHVLCGKVPLGSKRWVRNPGIKQRYQQMGNAVSPAVAAALGRCLALAAVGESPPGEPVIAVPDLQYEETVADLREKGLNFYYETVEDAENIIPVRTWLLSNPSTGNGGRGNDSSVGMNAAQQEGAKGDDGSDDEDTEFVDAEEF